MGKHTVKYFMWGYQDHFWLEAEISARRLLSRLDLQFDRCKPKVYLVGRQIESSKGFCAIGTAPDDSPFQPGTFAGLDALVSELEHADSERNFHHSLDIAQENARKAIKMRALRRAVLSKIEAVTNKEEVLTRKEKGDILL